MEKLHKIPVVRDCLNFDNPFKSQSESGLGMFVVSTVLAYKAKEPQHLKYLFRWACCRFRSALFPPQKM